MPLFNKEFVNRSQKPGQPRVGRAFNRIIGKKFVNPDSAMTVSAYYSGVIYLSTQVGKLPIYIKNREKKVLEKNDLHRILNVRPNPEMSAFDFWNLCIQLCHHKGNFYAEIERTISGKVKALWPILTDAVQPMRLNDGKLVYKVLAGDSFGGDVYLKPEDMFHVKNFPTLDGVTGMSTISYAADTLGVGMGANEFSNGLFANAGIPSGVIEVEGKLSDDARARLKSAWENNHSGKKVGGTAVLEAGASYKAISLSADQLQFIDTKKLNVSDIARFLRVPPTKLFDTDAAKFNNIEHSNLEVATDIIDAWAKNIENVIDDKLLSGRHGGLNAQFDIYEVFRGDMKSRADYFTKRMQTGSITPNQIREMEGDAPYSEGNDYYIASNNFTPIRRMDEVIDSQVKKSDNTNNKTEEEQFDEVAKNYLLKKVK